MLAKLSTPLEMVGIMIDSFGLSQLAFTASLSTHRYILEHGSWDVTLFIKDLAPQCVPTNFAIMQLYDGFGYKGALVATNLDLASKLLTFPGPRKKIFYVWDLEWFTRQMGYSAMKNIYLNDKLSIICRSQEHANVFEKVWHRKPDAVVPNLELNELIGGI
jgi:hypothetical protein